MNVIAKTVGPFCLLWSLLTFAVPACADIVELDDGTTLTGKIIEETEEFLILQTEILGRLEIPQSKITYVRREIITGRQGASGLRHGDSTRIEERGERFYHFDDPDKNSIMFCPTTDTVGKGKGYFRDFELLFLNFGYGLTEHLDLSMMTLFPIGGTSLVSVGLKAELLDRDTNPFGLAVSGSATAAESARFGGIAVTGGLGNRDRSLNLSLHKGFDFRDNDDSGWIYLIGADWRISSRVKLLVEYINSGDWSHDLDDDDDDDDNEFHGLINVGLRWFGRRMAFSLTGLRPLLDDSGDLIFLPMAMFSVHW